MPGRIYEADLTVPAGTPASAPVTLAFPAPQGAVTRVHLRIPSGPRGLAGWALLLAGTRIVPYSGGLWIIGDDDRLTWAINQEINDGELTVAGYNTGIYPHTFYARAEWVVSLDNSGVTASIAAASPETASTTAAIAGLSAPPPPAGVAVSGEVTPAPAPLAALSPVSVSAPVSLPASPAASGRLLALGAVGRAAPLPGAAPEAPEDVSLSAPLAALVAAGTQSGGGNAGGPPAAALTRSGAGSR